MNHPFYHRPQRERTKIQLLMAISAVLISAVAVVVAAWVAIWFLAIATFPIILSIIAPFFDVPAMRKSGKLIYYSPLFITEKEKDGVITIHGGTLFDYVFVIDRRMTGRQRTTFIIQQYLEGLLNLLEEYEGREHANLKIRGTSYIISERTARKMGFQVTGLDGVQKGLLVYSYYNLLLSNSIAKGRLAFPKLSRTITVESNLSELIARKQAISRLHERMKEIVE